MASDAETKSPANGQVTAAPVDRPQREGVGGARADFVASLGRKVADARTLLSSLETDPAARPAREELRRKLHALGAGARMLRFDAMARTIADATSILDRATKEGKAGSQDLLV